MPGIWLTQDEVIALPASGAAFNAVKAAADKADWGLANVIDAKYEHNINTLAGALMAVRLGGSYQARVETELRKLIGSETRLGERQDTGQVPVLALGRKLGSYVIAADLIGFREPAWVAWLSALRTRPLAESTSFGDSLVGCHEKRPNNFGTHAGFSRIAADLYLADSIHLARAVTVLKGWLGDRTAYVSFQFGSNAWHPDPAAKVGINPPGSVIGGHSVDGVLPDDQRRSGGTPIAPKCANYVRGALGPVLSTVCMLRRTSGYREAALWSNAAPLRAVRWLLDVCGCSFSGDDAWQPYLIRAIYGAPAASDGSPGARGKSMAFTGWTHA